MQLQGKLKLLEHVDHFSHKVTLALVGASLLAVLVSNIHASGHAAETALTKLLHFVHWFALAIVVLYLSARLLLERNVGKELASLMLNTDEFHTIGNAGAKSTAEESSKSKPPSRSLTLSVGPQDVEFVVSSSGHLAKVLFTMNREGFERSAFELTQDGVVRRNSALIDRSPKAFQIVRNKATAGSSARIEDFIGYTCVLPLNEIGADVYLRGLIKDKNIPASLLCRQNEPASAVLVFAIVLDRKVARSRSLKGKYFGFLLKALEYHISSVAEAYAGNAQTISVWAQSEHESLRKRLMERGFTSTTPRTKSADDYELLRLELPVPKPVSKETSQTEQADAASKSHLVSEGAQYLRPLRESDAEQHAEGDGPEAGRPLA